MSKGLNIGVTLEGDKELTRALNKFADKVDISRHDITIDMARATGQTLGSRVRPFGLGKRAKEIGENAVATDIAKVYISDKQAYNEIKRVNPGLAAAFARASSNGDIAKANDILHRAGVQGTYKAFSARDHESQRVDGRIKSPRQTIVSSLDHIKITAYRKLKQSHVGRLKSGWLLSIARLPTLKQVLTGKSRKPPKSQTWISRHFSKNIGSSNFHDGKSITGLDITNHSEYASEKTTQREVRNATTRAKKASLRTYERVMTKLTNELNKNT